MRFAFPFIGEVLHPTTAEQKANSNQPFFIAPSKQRPPAQQG
jgi:hypothetical protein